MRISSSETKSVRFLHNYKEILKLSDKLDKSLVFMVKYHDMLYANVIKNVSWR